MVEWLIVRDADGWLVVRENNCTAPQHALELITPQVSLIRLCNRHSGSPPSGTQPAKTVFSAVLEHVIADGFKRQ